MARVGAGACAPEEKENNKEIANWMKKEGFRSPLQSALPHLGGAAAILHGLTL